ncbi:GFA family protein [Plesiomonas shigelloides]|nr:GFA family protein [Plesiomonas shigelloides]
MDFFTGSCLCGNVSITINGPIEHVVHCHCRMCQKSHGSSYASFGLVRKENITIRANDSISSYRSSISVTRSFCRKCGSNIEWNDNSNYNSKYRSFSLGLLDSEFSPSSEEHIFMTEHPLWDKSSD